jgi:hypothetical protein
VGVGLVGMVVGYHPLRGSGGWKWVGQAGMCVVVGDCGLVGGVMWGGPGWTPTIW